jgi:hypothetical protein
VEDVTCSEEVRRCSSVGSGVAGDSATAGKEAISLRRGTKSGASSAESFSEGFIRFDANSLAI